MKSFLIYLIYILDILISAQWIPKLQDFNKPDFKQFHLYKWKKKPNLSLDKYPDHTLISLGILSLKSTGDSYIVYGAVKNADIKSSTAYAINSPTIVLCKINLKGKTEISSCNIFAPKNSTYIGATIATLTLSENKGIIIYCDPLWHNAQAKIPKPGGKCYLNLVEGQTTTNTSIEFCQLGSDDYKNCMAGFSADIINTVSGTKMAVGMPYMLPYGGVSLVTNLFQPTPKIDMPMYGTGKYYNFGYSLAMTNTENVYVSSPISDQHGPNVTEVTTGNIQLTSPDYVPFSSFGLSMETFSVKKGQSNAIIIGAPYHPKTGKQNVGKIYSFCLPKNGKSTFSTEMFGKNSDEYFGYVITNIGDINGDGNEDVAISSPFFRNTDKGFISLHAIDENCRISKEPIQKLMNIGQKAGGIYGVAIGGNSDIDFNGWPDIVVASSNRQTIDLYKSRPRYQANCTFVFDTDFRNYALEENYEFDVTIQITINDPRFNERLSIDVLKSFNLKSQVNLHYNRSENDYFKLNSKINHRFNGPHMRIKFQVLSLKSAKKMNLKTPVKFAYRFVKNCDNNLNSKCDYSTFPLIDWSNCFAKMPISKYLCAFGRPCNADINVVLLDESGSDIVQFRNKRTYQRQLSIVITNNGPTEAQDINVKLSMFQHLRFHRFIETEVSTTIIRQDLVQNDTELLFKLRDIELEVGNSVNISFRVYINQEPKMIYTNNSVRVELHSSVEDKNITNNNAQLLYRFVHSPNVTFTAMVSRETVLDMRNRSIYITDGQRVEVDQIGPRMTTNYLITNEGPESLKDMQLVFRLPVQTSGKEKDTLVYLFDQIRGVSDSGFRWLNITPQVKVTGKGVSNTYRCQLPKKFLNPRNLVGFETHAGHLMDLDTIGLRKVRLKRTVDETLDRSNNNQTEFSNVKFSKGKMNRILSEIIQCNRQGVTLDRAVCADIVCNIPEFLPHKTAKVELNSWLWSRTFFDKRLSDIMIYTNLVVNFGATPPGVERNLPPRDTFSQHQRFVFKNMKLVMVHLRLIWPIIVGIVVGVLILAIVIVALYKCGFFERSKQRRRSFRPLSMRSGGRAGGGGSGGKGGGGSNPNSNRNSRLYDPQIVHPHDYKANNH